MTGKIYLYLILLVIIGSIALIAVGNLRSGQSVSTSAKTDEVILYVGEGCPHCKNVEDFLTSHSEIGKTLKIEQKEVYENQSNAQELTDKAQSCKLETRNGVAVPFLYFKGECITGDQPIIDYLTKKTKV
jgi:glutaredoxin